MVVSSLESIGDRQDSFQLKSATLDFQLSSSSAHRFPLSLFISNANILSFFRHPRKAEGVQKSGRLRFTAVAFCIIKTIVIV